MVSYFKTQWFYFTVSCLFFIFGVVMMFKPAGDPNAIAGVRQDLETTITTVCLFGSAFLWFSLSMFRWNVEVTNKFNDRLETLENSAITDIVEVGHNHFVAFRRCGPDKNTPIPSSETTIDNTINKRLEDTNKRLAYFNATQKILSQALSGDAPIVIKPSELRQLAMAIKELDRVIDYLYAENSEQQAFRDLCNVVAKLKTLQFNMMQFNMKESK